MAPLIRSTLAAILILIPSTSNEALAQSGRQGDFPPGWEAVYDGGADGDRVVEVMRPGWHIFPGPGAMLWNSRNQAAGNYGVTTTIFLFAEGEGESNSRSAASPFGLIAGGERLGERGAAYTAFLIRNDGRFTIFHRSGSAIVELVAWEASDAIVTLAESEGITAENTLMVSAGDDEVGFWINDEKVAGFPRDELALEGSIGLRAGGGLSLHVSALSIGPERR